MGKLRPSVAVTFVGLALSACHVESHVTQVETPDPPELFGDSTSGRVRSSSSTHHSSSSAKGDNGSSGGLSSLLEGKDGGGGPSREQELYDALSSAPAATPDTAPVTAGKDAVAKKLLELAKTAAPGMLPDGPLLRATLKEGERAQAELDLKTDHCYAIVAYGDKIADLDLHVMVAPAVLVAEDTTSDNAPVVGRAPDPLCPKEELTYRLGILAEKGAGTAGVQVFSKKK